jgi:hypothetical protein
MAVMSGARSESVLINYLRKYGLPGRIARKLHNQEELSVIAHIEAVLRKIEYWHQGSIAGFKILYRDEHGSWDGTRSMENRQRFPCWGGGREEGYEKAG